MEKPKTLTTQEAAEQLGVNVTTIRRWIERKKIKGAKRVGQGAHSIWFIPKEAIEGLRRANSGKPPVSRG
jgi:excisionase family DNA binding protein